MAVNRIIVDASRYDEFVERFVAKARALTVGDPAQASTAIGPIINQAQLEGLQEKIAKAKQEGAKVLLEGEGKGQVLPPHVFGDEIGRASCREREWCTRSAGEKWYAEWYGERRGEV